MPAVFQWLPWARTTGRPPSSSVKLRKAIYVARVASNKDDGVDNSGEPQFLYGAALDHHGGAEFIEADGKIRNETEYEVLNCGIYQQNQRIDYNYVVFFLGFDAA